MSTKSSLAATLGIILLVSCSTEPGRARFTQYCYQGNDECFEQTIDPSSQYLNPVVAGFHPDPSVCYDGEKYYLVNSSFSFFPGVPIFASSDLVGWEQIGHVLDRDSQVDLIGGDVSAGIFAPAVSYNEANGSYYMVTMNMTNYRVFYVKSQNPAEGWSEPIYLSRGGMDPSLFFDDDGKGYMVYTTRPADGWRYVGDMAICMNELDTETDTIKYETTQLAREGVWLEGPHLYKHEGYYYLMCAEGGTGDNHKEVIFRSRDIHGPYKSCPCNPILAQPLGGAGDFPVSSTGHADIIETADGSWWAVFLACRPYEGDYYNTGRETFLLPVTWEDGWPMILPRGETLPIVVNKGDLDASASRPTGNITFTDNFREGNSPRRQWLRNPERERYSFDRKGLTIEAAPVNIYGKDQPSAVFYRQYNTNFSASTTLDFTPQTEEELAGIVLMQDAEYNFVFGKTLIDGAQAVTLTRSEGSSELIAAVVLPKDARSLSLKVDGRGGAYSFSYRLGRGEWTMLAADVDATNLSTHKAGGFVSCMIGLYATTNK